jgi:hypothetical protein
MADELTRPALRDVAERMAADAEAGLHSCATTRAGGSSNPCSTCPTSRAGSPRLRRMGAYAVTREGALQRHPLAYGEELRPFTPA